MIGSVAGSVDYPGCFFLGVVAFMMWFTTVIVIRSSLFPGLRVSRPTGFGWRDCCGAGCERFQSCGVYYRGSSNYQYYFEGSLHIRTVV